MKIRAVVATVSSLILGLLIAFFGVFNVLFSDIFGFSQQAGAVGYVFSLYLVASLILHWPRPTGVGQRWILLAPALVFIIFIALQDQTRYGYTLMVAIAVIAGTWLGWFVRMGTRQLRKGQS